ncbi:MAG: hypothetical protein WA853_03130 [Candidatus Acidiferrum sp.]
MFGQAVRLLAVVFLVAELLGAAASDAGDRSSKTKKKRAADEDISAETALPPGLNLQDVVNQIIARENDEITDITLYTPIMETYIQAMKPDKSLGMVPKSDYYFLGQLEFNSNRVPKLDPIVHHPKTGAFLQWSFQPDGFAEMVFVDSRGLDKENYQFTYRGREFLGEIRCLVFDLVPKPKSGRGRFLGRIWVDEKSFTIVRANGEYTNGGRLSSLRFSQGAYFHFETWRSNVRSNLWLPSYIYTQELSQGHLAMFPEFKGQIRLWGYQLKNIFHEEEFSKVTVEAATDLNDESTHFDNSPLQSERAWRNMAEENVAETLEKDGLLAPPGPVDKVLNTIVNNLEVTNHLDSQVDMHCRLLLTGNIDMFTVGQTIFLSRGLIDVVPDEATLATVLAQEMADALNPNPAVDQYAFSDIIQTTPQDLFKKLSFREFKGTAQDNSQKALELLKNSPYADHLGSTALFLRQLNAESKSLKQFISPHMGNRIVVADQLLAGGPPLKPNDLDQVSALPLGSRIRLDAWTDSVDLMKAKQVAMLSAREKMPFEITPFEPYLTRSDRKDSAMLPAAVKEDIH